MDKRIIISIVIIIIIMNISVLWPVIEFYNFTINKYPFNAWSLITIPANIILALIAYIIFVSGIIKD